MVSRLWGPITDNSADYSRLLGAVGYPQVVLDLRGAGLENNKKGKKTYFTNIKRGGQNLLVSSA